MMRRSVPASPTSKWVALYVFLAAALGMAILALVWSVDKTTVNALIESARGSFALFSADQQAALDGQGVSIDAATDSVSSLSTVASALVTASSSVVSTGPLRWYSNCQVGTRASDGYSIDANTLSFAQLEGKPESIYTIYRVPLSNGMIRHVVEFTPPSADVDFSAQDATNSCKTIAATNSSTAFFDIGQGYYYDVTCLIPQDNITLTPPCNGTTCDLHQFSQTRFFSIQENSQKIGYAVIYMWSKSDYSSGDKGETIFVARNLSISGNLYCS
jgi:hypothetical protein